MPRTHTSSASLTRAPLPLRSSRALWRRPVWKSHRPPPLSPLIAHIPRTAARYTFYNNPWTLVTLLSGLASLFSILESLVTIISLRTLVVALPITGIAVYGLSERRRIMTAHRGR